MGRRGNTLERRRFWLGEDGNEGMIVRSLRIGDKVCGRLTGLLQGRFGLADELIQQEYLLKPEISNREIIDETILKRARYQAGSIRSVSNRI